MPKDLASLSNKESVTKLVMKLKNKKEKLKVWQNRDRKREYVYASISNIDNRNEIIRFKVESNDANKFTTADYLFFHSPHRDMIFKADIKKIENGAIYALFPSLIKLTEARIEKRESYGVNGYQNAKISYQDKHNEKITIEVSILDSSSSGLAVMVSDAVGHDLNINDKIKVHEVTLDVTKIVRIYVIRSKVVMDKVRPDTIFFRLGLELFA